MDIFCVQQEIFFWWGFTLFIKVICSSLSPSCHTECLENRFWWHKYVNVNVCVGLLALENDCLHFENQAQCATKMELQHYSGKTRSIAVARLWVKTLGENSLLWEHPLHYCDQMRCKATVECRFSCLCQFITLAQLSVQTALFALKSFYNGVPGDYISCWFAFR